MQGRTVIHRTTSKGDKKGSDSSCLAQETLGNIRTVISLNREDYFIEKYKEYYQKESRWVHSLYIVCWTRNLCIIWASLLG